MSQLQLKPKYDEISSGVYQIQSVTAENSGLKYIEFKVLELKADSVYQEDLQGLEACIVAVSGKINIRVKEDFYLGLGARKSVFEKIPTDSLYVSRDESFEITATTDARVAICYAPATKSLPTKLIKAEDNTVENRGKGHNQRLVHNILPDDVPHAESLLVVEVYTESGNTSSYPPHKHDRDNLPHESLLEETYYHEVYPEKGFVFQRVYTDDRGLDESMAVENKDVILVPKGYHPVAVPDSYTSYYLNVMAGPKRVWKFHNDPDHEWILEQDR